MSIDAKEFHSSISKGYEYWECPYCKHSSQLNDRDVEHLWMQKNDDSYYVLGILCPNPKCHQLTIYKSKYTLEIIPSIHTMGTKGWVLYGSEMLYPHGVYNHYPDFVPEPIREDYKEAACIASLSPKASAALIRRALQGMIMDKWPDLKDKKLFDQINELDEKVQIHQKQALHGIRKIGNVGAHMNNPGVIADQDSPITVDDAGKLIKLLEYLLKSWYLDEADAMALMKGISDRGDEVKRIQKGKTKEQLT